MPSSHLAIDLGAGSGRAILGVLHGDPKVIRLSEVHRFEHASLPTPTGPVWDITGLWREVLVGLQRGAEAAADLGVPLASVGVDTWAVDWALVSDAGGLIVLPHAYRDPANTLAKQRVLDRLPGGVDTLYARNGIQPQPFNTLFQIEARRSPCPRAFDALAEQGTLMMLADLLHYWLTGAVGCERTNASSTAMLDPETGDWDRQLLEDVSLPTTLLPPLIDPGTILGPLRGAVASESRIEHDVMVVAPATHDTASAVAAVPATGDRWAYLSSGTWSLLGVELDTPITSPAAASVPFTNERGLDGTVRFLRNITGLWLLQELRRDLAVSGNAYDHAQLAEAAQRTTGLRTIVDPNHPDLAEPGGVIAKLRRLARDHDEPEPITPGDLARCCLDSLALSYAETLEVLEATASTVIDTLHIVGGGGKNRLLNQLTADATGRSVVAGPTEATASGNALVQAMGLGIITDRDEIRQIVGRSESLDCIEPSRDSGAFDAARNRFRKATAQ